jgi:ATP-binding cassette, subfamily B, vacuolar membrane transporter HMT1/ACLQ
VGLNMCSKTILAAADYRMSRRTDALMSYETIHYNGAIGLETARFENLTLAFQSAEWKVLSSLNLLNAVQNGIFTIGLLVVCYLDAFQISRHQQQVANFVILLTYLAQLQAPLNFFGSFYTQVQNTLVDAERMLELVSEQVGNNTLKGFIIDTKLRSSTKSRALRITRIL